MVDRTNIPPEEVIRTQIKILDGLRDQLLIQIAAQGKKMRDMLDISEIFPNDRKYRLMYEQYQKSREEYQLQHDVVVNETASLKTLLMYISHRPGDLEGNKAQ